MNTTEEKIVEKLKTGGEGAFDDLLNAYGARLYSFATRMCHNEEDAKDILQETLIGVFKSVKDYRGEGRFQAWLFTIAANACRKMKRKGKFEPEQELSLDDFMPTSEEKKALEISDRSQNPAAATLRAELRNHVEAAIAELPAQYRVVLILRDIEQLSTDETANALGLSAEAVKSRLHRARLFVRQQLAPYWQAGA